jgi:hypothetical protein
MTLARARIWTAPALSNTAQAGNASSAADDVKAGQSDNKKGSQSGLKGEQDQVKGQDGKEVSLRTDQSTPKTGNMSQRDRIETDANDQNRKLSSGSTETPDRRNDKRDS